jgi:hypothetical protein
MNLYKFSKKHCIPPFPPPNLKYCRFYFVLYFCDPGMMDYHHTHSFFYAHTIAQQSSLYIHTHSLDVPRFSEKKEKKHKKKKRELNESATLTVESLLVGQSTLNVPVAATTHPALRKQAFVQELMDLINPSTNDNGSYHIAIAMRGNLKNSRKSPGSKRVSFSVALDDAIYQKIGAVRLDGRSTADETNRQQLPTDNHNNNSSQPLFDDSAHRSEASYDLAWDRDRGWGRGRNISESDHSMPLDEFNTPLRGDISDR